MHEPLLKKKLIRALIFNTLFIGAINTQAQQNALDFDGINDYISTNYSGISGNTAKTIEAWIKTTKNSITSGQSVIVDWGTLGTGTRFTFCILTNNAIRLEVQGSGLSGNIAVNDGAWHHVAAVYNPTATNKVSLYVDGILDTAGNLTTTVNTGLATTVRIGSRIDTVNFFQGDIDEVRIWDKALTQAEIQANKNIEFCSPPNNLKAYFKINEGTVGANNTLITSIPSTVGSYTGTLIGFALTGTTSNFIAGTTNLGSPNNTVSVSGGTLTAAQGGATYQWLDCNNANAPISGATNQSFTPSTVGNYAVAITIGGCNATSACQTITTLGTNDYKYETSNLSVSPNPTKNLITINSNDMVNEVEIINLNGQRMMYLKPNMISPTIDISDWVSGIYIVKVNTDHYSKSFKIIKN